MRQILFYSIFFLFHAVTNLKAQGDILFMPFLGSTNTEDIIVYNSKTGETAQWYFDKSNKKMIKEKGGFKIMNTGFEDGRTMMQSYIGAGHTRVILTWNTSSARSVSWYYNNNTKKLEKSPLEYQLPQNIGLSGSVMMHAYLDKENTEIILCWETTTGKSISFYYNRSAKKFMKSMPGYQLPEDPGVKGKIRMHPYITKDGSEAVLVWDVNTGNSIAYYYERNVKKYVKSPEGFQLPANTGINEEVMMYPYIGRDGSEDILVWNCKTGKSVSWNYDLGEKKFMPSPDSYQLPVSFTENVMMIPRVENGDEVIYVWNSTNGQSVNYLFDMEKKRYVKSEQEYQLPPNPFE
ncbi:MAG: hypothetical protein HY840_09645 [Bacteroidetes bacterium]|nr:hypothetical protein [Bacteroidota bacterium]